VKVEIRPALDAEKRALVRSLYPLYLQELSTFTDYYKLDARGQWQPDHLPDWLRGDHQHAFLIYADGVPAGLCFVAQAPFPHMKKGCDHQISEFFVLEAFRERGVGTVAAHQVLDRFPGRWAVTELEANVKAVSFWRRIIAGHTGGAFTETKDPGELVQRFEVP
jgi:predicted acetyltransferase